MKTKIAAIITAIGGLCALCCVVPIAGVIGLGALEAFFCDSPWAISMGIGLMAVGIGILALQYFKRRCSPIDGADTCAVSCKCR